MNGYALDDSSCWPPLLARRVEEVCKRFEAVRKAGQRPRIEHYIADSDEPERSVLLRELLALELEYSTKQGEQPTPQDYEHLFPQHQEVIRQAFRDLLPPFPLPDLRRPGTRGTPPADLPPPFSTYPTAPPAALQGGTTVWPDSSHDPVPPTIPGYEILGVLGRGGMGIVYRARDLRLDRQVALKMMLASAEATERSRFRNEAQAVARLQHPHIVQIYEVGEQDGLPYICLEYVDGGSLRDKLAGTPLPPEPAAQLSELLARAVHFAHERGIIHRDLKPANILLVSGGLVSGDSYSESTPLHHSPLTPKIADFGLAKRLDGDSARTQTRSGALVGTPSYMAPEQATGRNRAIGPATDVYALGAVLYEMLTGRPPFQGATVFETLEQVCSQEPVAPTHLQPRLPRDLETICVKCLQKEPRKRYASAEALAEDLRCFLTGEPIRARPTPLWERGLKWMKRRPMAATLAAAVIVAAAGLIGGALLYLQQGKRIAQKELRDHDRLAAARSETQDLLAQGGTEKAQQNWSKSKELLAQALARAGDEPALADLVARIRELLAEVDRQLDEQEARRKAVAQFQKFMRLRDEALYQGTMFTGADLPTSLAASGEAAQSALDCFDLKNHSQSGLEHLKPDERAAITAGCYEMFLVLAESLARDQPQRALAKLEQASRLGLETRAYHMRRARYFELLHDPAAAKMKQDATQRPAVSAFDHFLVGEDFYRQGQLLPAISEFEEVLREQPDQFWARYFLAVCYLRLPHPAARSARDCLTACLLRDQREFPGLFVLRGYAHGLLELFSAAEADFQKALDLKPSTEAIYAVLVNRGLLRLRQKKPKEAVADLKAAIALKQGPYQAYMNLAKVYEEENNLVAAIEQLNHAIETAEPLVQAKALECSALTRLYYDRAKLHRQAKDLKAALAGLDRAIQVEPRGSKSEILAIVHTERGSILLVTKDYAKAIAALDAALSIRARDPEAHLGRAEALFEQRRFEDAVLAFDAYFQHGGKPQADVYRKRAQAQARLHKYSEAIADYTLALRLGPKADTYVNRGWIHVVTNSHKSALDDFEEAIRRDPKNSDAHNGRGLMRAKLGLANAAGDAQEALRLGPKTDPRHVWSAARIYAELAGRMDSDRDWHRSQALTARFDYQHEAVQLLRQALGLTDSEERASFWHGKIEGDRTFDSIRSSVDYAQLRAEFAPKR
jgi:serine/threonine protein kinase/Tfp pilus assembly protein PilF